MKIRQLPAEARSKLESGLVITDAVRCIIELVHNALDAEATAIAVKVDLKNYLIQVIDNGKGIGKDDLELVGERFMTSKYQPLTKSNRIISTYGYKGQAISSLLDVCRSLTIKTKSVPDGPSFVKVFKNNSSLPIIENSTEKNGTGTTVIVEDFMCTMPVRRKRISEVFDMEEIKTQIQYLAIIHHNVSFTVRNESKNAILLQKRPSASVLLSISSIFGSKIAKSLKPINYQDKKFKITGFVSTKTQAHHNIQLVYVNKRIITKGVIHKFVNNMMKQYLDDQNLFEDSSMEGGVILQKLKNPSHHVFIVVVRCPNAAYEVFTNVKKSTVEFKNWKEVMKCIHKGIRKVFKGDENSLDSSVGVSKRKIRKKNEENLRKGKFGTSLLINAIRGVPAKRKSGNNKRNNKKVKKKRSNNSTTSELLVNEETVESVLQTTGNNNDEEYKSDSSESPIPKSQFQSNPHIDMISETPNESFSDFYKWLKMRYKTDENAYNLYQDFLLYKRGTKNFYATPKSPVLGEICKRKRTLRSSKKSRKREKFLRTTPEMDINQSINEAERQMNVAPIDEFLVDNRKLVEEVTFNEPVLSPILNSNQKGTVFWDKSSPPTSEAVFKNLLRLRNLSEGTDTRCQKKVRNKASSTYTHTWMSHYQNPVAEELRAYDNLVRSGGYHLIQENNTESNFFYKNNSRGCTPDESSNINNGFLSFKQTTQVMFQDAGIQTTILADKSPVRMANAVVQTINDEVSVIPDSQSFEKDFLKNRETNSNIRSSQRDTQISGNISQEVPHPDFWNFPTPEDIGKSTQNNFLTSKTNSKSKHNTTPVEKCSSSSEFICGQKTNSSKPHTLSAQSKETQTLAALWTDCLEEIDNPSRSGLNIEESQLPETIPVEELGSIVQAPPDIGFCLTERHDFMPKGLSPKFVSSEELKVSTLSSLEKSRILLTLENPENELLANVKWINEATGAPMKPAIPDGILNEMRQKVERSKNFFEGEILSASLSYCAIKVHNLLHSFVFTKELLSSVQILGQLDKKFVVAKMDVSVPKKMELISLFDQHAVDERVKLEELIQEFVTPDGQLIFSSLNSSIECVLNESVVRVLSNLEAKLIDFGLVIKILNENTVSINAVPLFLLEKHKKNLKNKKTNYLADFLPDLVTKVAEELTETRGAALKIPKIVHNAFCSEACHKAIRFNRTLEAGEMIEMINKLKDCKLPFQCAHGRPSVIPIIDLEDFKTVESENGEIDFQKVRNFTFRKSSQDDIIENSEEPK